jgi:hypothetical protein
MVDGAIRSGTVRRFLSARTAERGAPIVQTKTVFELPTTQFIDNESFGFDLTRT